MSILSTGTTTGTACSLTADTTGDCVIKTGSSATTAMTISGSTQAVTLAAGLTGTTATLSGAVSVTGNLEFNSGYGYARIAYGCRAWVNFNGTGTVAIRAGANVHSITDNGIGDYTVNFLSGIVDANYAATGVSGRSTPTAGLSIYSATAPNSESIRVATDNGAGSNIDLEFVHIAVFR